MRSDLLIFALHIALCAASTNSTGDSSDEGSVVGMWFSIIGGTLCFIGIAAGSYWYYFQRPKEAGAKTVTQDDTPTPAAANVALPLMPSSNA
jgi:hypothetical protein